MTVRKSNRTERKSNRAAKKSLRPVEKSNEKIAVEIKSFTGRSQTAGLEQALGRFSLYYSVMKRTDTDRKLYLAVPDTISGELFENDIAPGFQPPKIRPYTEYASI